MLKSLRPTTIIPPNLYVDRNADRQLDDIVDDMGRPGYVLVARQMGKTNLLINMKRRRERIGNLVIYLDLSTRFDTIRALFRHIIDQIIEADAHIGAATFDKVVQQRDTLSIEPNVEYDRHLRMILQSAEGRRVILVLDEIDSLTSVRYSNAFFAQIRSMYFSRINYPEYERLTYVLSGVAEPADLITDKNISPFNIGEKIYLEDFTIDEVQSLIDNAGLRFSNDVVAEIYSWISGNPRMTWDVCSALEDIQLSGKTVTKSDVTDIINNLYLGLFSRAPVDHIRALTKDDPQIRNAIASIRSGDGDALDEKTRVLLYLAGISHNAGSGTPKLRNRVIDIALSDERLAQLAEPSSTPYDLFISYNRADAEVVDGIVRILQRRGLRVFQSRWALEAGRTWMATLEKSLMESKAVAVFLGPKGLGTWERREASLALDQGHAVLRYRPEPTPASGQLNRAVTALLKRHPG